MPNWTLNRLVLTLPYPKRWESFEMRQTRWEIFRNLKYKFENLNIDDQNEYFTEFFNIIKPRPKEQEENWHDWNICNWGTKWEPKFYDIEIENNTMTFKFETAWSFPHSIYLYLERLNFEIHYSHASFENCDYGWGGNEWDEDHYYEIIELDYDEIHEVLKNEEEIYYFDRIVHMTGPEIEENNDLHMINFMVNCLAYHFDMILDGYYDWRIENNLDDTDDFKKENLRLKNKLIEWLEDDVEKGIRDEDTYLRVCNVLKNSTYIDTNKKYIYYLWKKFSIINYYGNKHEPEPKLDLIYC